MHKELVYLKGFAQGKEYWDMMRAIDIAILLHNGQMRKDGGEYIEHPMKVCSQLVSLKLYSENMLVAAILHDVLEDCNITSIEMVNRYNFNDETMKLLDLLNKNGIKTATYYDHIKFYPEAVLIKIADRCHNVSTMTGAFSVEKMKEYIKETEDFVLPLCKYAINFYPQYSNEVTVMRSHIRSVLHCVKYFINESEKTNEKISIPTSDQ